MASLPPLPRHSKFAATLKYFDKHDYPLTAQEQITWFSPGEVGKVEKTGDYFHLPGRSQIANIRRQREKYSQIKWQISRRVGEKLKTFSTIQAIFITGSLAMDNATDNDDIDLMIVTSANTLWITRFFVNIFLHAQRRFPNHVQVNNKICPNLWLDENNLHIATHDLYRAHEVLQAKVLWDRNNIQNQFLSANSWVKDYLPNAYLTLDPSPKLRRGKAKERYWIKIINYVFFIGQYLYMLPKMTTERVGSGFAFFHPNKHE